MANLTSQLVIKLVDDVTGPVNSVAAALKKAEGQIKSVDNAFRGTNASSTFQRQLAGIGRSAAEIDKVASAWKDYARSAAGAEGATNWTRGATQQVRAWEQATIKSLRQVESAEKAFEKQQMAVGAAQNRRFLPHGPGGVVRSGRVGELAGTAGIFAGPGILHGVKETVLSGADLEREKQKLRAAGIPEEEIERTTKQTTDIATRVPNVKMKDALEDYKHLRSSLNHPDEAPAPYEDVLRAHAAMNAADSSGHMAESMPFLLKGAELTGRTKSPEDFRRYMDQFVKGQQVMGKTITPEQQFEFAKYARANAPQLSDRFLGTTALSLGQEMGGSGAGTALATLQRELQAGFPGNHGAAKEFVRLGLANEEDFEKTKTGEIKGLKEGKHVQGWRLAMTDPDQWWYQYGKPALEKAGITDPQAQAAEITKMFPNRTASDLISKFNNQQGAFQQHAQQYSVAQGLGAAESNQRDPYQAFGSLTTSLTNLAGIASGPAVSKAAEGLSTLGKAIAGFTPQVEAWTKAHPTEAAVAGGVGVAGAGYLGSRALIGGARSIFGRGGAAAAVQGVGAEASVLSLGAAITTLGGAAVGATGLITGLYAAMAATDPLGKEERKRRDDEILTREGRQPGGPNENTINPFATGGWKPWVKDMFSGGQPVGTDGTGPQLPGYQPYGVSDLRAAAAPPSWTVNQPQKSFPMTGVGGATAGVEGPEFPNLTGLNGASGVVDALNQGAQTQAAGAATGAGYMDGLRSQLDAAASYAEEIAQRIRNALDFSVTPTINSPSGSAETPRRTSSLGAYDHGRASAAGSAGWPLG